MVNPGERLLYPQLLLVFVLALRRGEAGTATSSAAAARAVASGAVVVALLSVVNLIVSTASQGYRGVAIGAFETAQQGYAERFYWHRPYQFLAMQEHMQTRHAQGRAPQMPITFTTSLIGMHPSAATGSTDR